MDINLSESITCSGVEMKKYMKSMDEKDIDKFLVLNGKLMFIGNDDYERKIAEDAGIDTSLSNGNFSVEDLKVLAGSVLSLGNEVEVPVGDNGESPEELVGTRLYDKVPQNEDKWDIVIEYNENNEKIKTHGTGYYYLKKGSYTINGKSVTLENDYIIDYRNRKFYALENKYREWNIGSTIAVTKDLVLNTDPTNFEKYVNEDGTLNEKALKNEANIIKHGDVSYSKENKALLFNEDESSNPEGEGGYLELDGGDVDFSNGFTFEIYANFSRLIDRISATERYMCGGIFCRMPSLSSPFLNSVRFGFLTDTGIFDKNLAYFAIKVCNIGVSFNGYRMKSQAGWIMKPSDSIVMIGEDVSISCTYQPFKSLSNLDILEDNSIKECLEREKITSGCLLRMYLNGMPYGWTINTLESFNDGLKTWNKDLGDIFIGVCPWDKDGSLHFLKGKVYSIRLYKSVISSEDVKSNYDFTLQYRNTF